MGLTQEGAGCVRSPWPRGKGGKQSRQPLEAKHQQELGQLYAKGSNTVHFKERICVGFGSAFLVDLAILLYTENSRIRVGIEQSRCSPGYVRGQHAGGCLVHPSTLSPVYLCHRLVYANEKALIKE